MSQLDPRSLRHALSKVQDQAVRIMLEHFAKESKLGNYGVYFGNQNSGEVRTIVKEHLMKNNGS